MSTKKKTTKPDVIGRAVHLGSIYIWNDITDDRFAEFKDALVSVINREASKLMKELDNETEEIVTNPLPKPKKRKEKMS